MNTLVLDQNTAGPLLVVRQSFDISNNQVIVFKYYGQCDSYPLRLELSWSEGCYTDFNIANLLALWNVNNITPNRIRI